MAQDERSVKNGEAGSQCEFEMIFWRAHLTSESQGVGIFVTGIWRLW
jgi:hypothetical protein